MFCSRLVQDFDLHQNIGTDGHHFVSSTRHEVFTLAQNMEVDGRAQIGTEIVSLDEQETGCPSGD